MSRSLLLAPLLVVLMLLLATITGVQAATPEKVLEAGDFKKMKIKEIRQFLDDRGLACADCQEKSDFIRFAVKNNHVAVLSGKVKVPLPEGAFWEVWANVAKTMCLEAGEKKGVEGVDKICKAVESATDSLFMQHGKRTATKLKKKPDALKVTSWGEPYQPAGRKMFSNLLTHCFEEKNRAACSSSSKLQVKMEDKKKVKGVDFIMYLTNVGIENTNPMYEILKAKSSAHDEL